MAKLRRKKSRRRGDEAVESAGAVSSQTSRSRDVDQSSEQEQWAGKQDHLTRATRVAGIGAILCGPVALGMVAMGGASSVEPIVAPEPTGDIHAEAQASELARQLTVSWLEGQRGDEQLLERFVNVSVNLPREQVYRVSDPDVAGIERVEDPAATGPQSQPVEDLEVYAVTVAAWVSPFADPEASEVRRHYQVPVTVSDQGARAVAVPSPVALPEAVSGVQTAYRMTASEGHPMIASAEEFLGAMLAGSGDISRYTSPGVQIQAVSPPVAESVSVTTAEATEELPDENAPVADGREARILLTVELADAAAGETTAQYALTMTARAGRWEVSEIEAEPALRVGEPQSQSSQTGGSDSADGSAMQEAPVVESDSAQPEQPLDHDATDETAEDPDEAE